MSAGSGIKIGDEIKNTYSKIGRKGKDSKTVYAVIGFNDKKDGLVVLEESSDAKSYIDVISSLPTDDVRYVFFDFPYIAKISDAKTSKVLCISW